MQSYTNASTPLKLPTSADVTRVEDWTLGGVQISWLDRTLKASGHPFKFLCIHHAVGGDGGNGMDTLYGRGGARAARVGNKRLCISSCLTMASKPFSMGTIMSSLMMLPTESTTPCPAASARPGTLGQKLPGMRGSGAIQAMHGSA